MADYSITAPAAATVKPKPEAAADKFKEMKANVVSVCDVPEAGAELKWMKNFREELKTQLRPHDNLDKDIARLEKGLAACGPSDSQDVQKSAIRHIRS